MTSALFGGALTAALWSLRVPSGPAGDAIAAVGYWEELEQELRQLIPRLLEADVPPIDEALLDAVRDADVAAAKCLDAARDPVAEQDSQVAEAKRLLADVQARQEALAQQERSAWRAAEDFRVQIQMQRMQRVLATTETPEGRSARQTNARKMEDLERQYLAALENDQSLRRKIADLVTEKKRLELSLEQTLARRVTQDPASWPAVAEAREHLVAQLGPLCHALITSRGGPAWSLRPQREHPGTEGDSDLAGAPANVVQTDRLELQGDDKVLDLRTRMLSLKASSREHRRRSTMAVAVAFLAAGVFGVIGVAVHGLSSKSLIWSYGAAFVVVAGAFAVRQRGRARDELDELTEARNELDLLTIDRDAPEQRAQKLLQVNQFDLKRYYDQTLRQGSYIFYVGVACIGLGFVVIGVAFALVRNASADDLSEQIIVGALGSVGAILANFIAVVFLRMYSATIRSVATFHNRLVGTHDLYFANLLAAKIEGPEKREAAIAAIAVKAAEARAHEPNTSDDLLEQIRSPF